MDRPKFSRLLSATVMLISSHSALAITQYRFSGPEYGVTEGAYTGTMSLSGSFSTNTPLPSDMLLTSIADRVITWNFTDGINSYTPLNSIILGDDPDSFRVETDSSGNITNYIISFVTPKSPHPIGSSVSGFFIAKYFEYPSGLLEAVNNGTCDSETNSVCLTINPSLDYQYSTEYSFTWATNNPNPQPSNPIPTLTEELLLLMSVLLFIPIALSQNNKDRRLK